MRGNERHPLKSKNVFSNLVLITTISVTKTGHEVGSVWKSNCCVK